jgi:hypothetical protein
MKGKIVGELPKRRGKMSHDWEGMARLAQQNPGKAVLAATHVPESTTKSVRVYRRKPFVQPDGKIVVNVRNSRIEADGVRYGDVYMTWVPNEQE